MFERDLEDFDPSCWQDSGVVLAPLPPKGAARGEKRLSGLERVKEWVGIGLTVLAMASAPTMSFLDDPMSSGFAVSTTVGPAMDVQAAEASDSDYVSPAFWKNVEKYARKLKPATEDPAWEDPEPLV